MMLAADDETAATCPGAPDLVFGLVPVALGAGFDVALKELKNAWAFALIPIAAAPDVVGDVIVGFCCCCCCWLR